MSGDSLDHLLQRLVSGPAENSMGAAGDGVANSVTPEGVASDGLPSDDLASACGSRAPMAVNSMAVPSGAVTSVADLLAQLDGKPGGSPVQGFAAGRAEGGDRLDVHRLESHRPAPGLLNDLKAHYQALDAAEAEARQASLERERQAALGRQALERQVLEHQAQTWLAQLDPLDGETLWFEQFAECYESRLEAAIAYLATTAENGTP